MLIRTGDKSKQVSNYKEYYGARNTFTIHYSTDSSYFNTSATYQYGRSDHVRYIKNRDSFDYYDNNYKLSKIEFSTDLSEEWFFQQSLIYDDRMLRAIYIMSYLKYHTDVEYIRLDLSEINKFQKFLRRLNVPNQLKPC